MENHVDGLARDFLYALRNLRKNRRSSLVAIFALALGIGATAVMFSVIHSVVIDGLPYKNFERSVVFRVQNLANVGGWKGRDFFLPDETRAFREQNHVFEETIAYNGIRLQYDNGKSIPYGEKTRPGRCSEPELITQRPLMINQAREVFCQGRLPASLIYVLVVSPWPAVPSTFMPLPFRNTSAGRPVVLDTALLPCSFLPPSAKETRSDCLCPDGCALRGNVRYIAATLAAATILQTGSASTDILLSPTSPSVLRTSSNSGSLLAIEADSRFPS